VSTRSSAKFSSLSLLWSSKNEGMAQHLLPVEQVPAVVLVPAVALVLPQLACREVLRVLWGCSPVAHRILTTRRPRSAPGAGVPHVCARVLGARTSIGNVSTAARRCAPTRAPRRRGSRRDARASRRSWSLVSDSRARVGQPRRGLRMNFHQSGSDHEICWLRPLRPTAASSSPSCLTRLSRPSALLRLRVQQCLPRPQ